MSFAQIAKKITQNLVLVTGGEPLAQAQTASFLDFLCQQGKQVQLETSGAYDISQINPDVHCVLDLKTPSSGEVKRMLWQNLEHLKANDEVKFVLSNREDYDWARSIITKYELDKKEATLLLSPAWQCLEPSTLGDWMLADQVKARLHIQQHKYIWGDIKGV